MRGTSEAARAKRRKKVMDAAVRLAAQGGLEAVQIRDVVARTGVSSATIYRYFASKEELLVAALADQRFALRQLLGDAQPTGSTAAERVISLLGTPTAALTAGPRLTAAMIQAITSGAPGVPPLLAAIRDTLAAETAEAIRPGAPTHTDYTLAMIIQRVWFAAVVGWVTGAETPESIHEAVEAAAHHLLDERPSA